MLKFNMASDSFKNLKKSVKDNYEIYDQRHALLFLKMIFQVNLKI